MAKGRGDFTDILIKKHILGQDQSPRRGTCKRPPAKLQDAIVKLGYASQVMAAVDKAGSSSI